MVLKTKTRVFQENSASPVANHHRHPLKVFQRQISFLLLIIMVSKHFLTAFEKTLPIFNFKIPFREKFLNFLQTKFRVR